MNIRWIMLKSVMIAMGVIGIAHADNKWTGLYAGVNTGLALNDVQLKSQQLGFTNPNQTCNNSSDFSTFSPGIQLGYLYQFPNDFVSGVEANLTFNADQIQSLGCNSNINPHVYDHFNFRNQMQTSIKGRVGRALNWHQNIFLPYLTAGASFANVGLIYKNEGHDYYSSHDNFQAGALIGGGIEWTFWQNWSLRAEYYYVDYGNAVNLNI